MLMTGRKVVETENRGNLLSSISPADWLCSRRTMHMHFEY